MVRRITLPGGFSLIELMLVMAAGITLMAIALPSLSSFTESTKLNEAARQVERELQMARLQAVNTNRALRVRLNCPDVGSFRIVEVLQTAEDTPTTRCLLANYPYPAADMDLLTRPNFDGALQVLPAGATVTTGSLEFQPDGSAYNAVTGTAQIISTPVTLIVARAGASRTVTINAAGKVDLK